MGFKSPEKIEQNVRHWEEIGQTLARETILSLESLIQMNRRLERSQKFMKDHPKKRRI
jgi:hypothetical protein